MIKELSDRVFAIFLIVALLPLFLLTMILVYLNDGSPILFVQERPGYHEEIFNIYKFRTMTNKKDSSGKLLPDQERLTKIGKLIRSLSMDELPQLFNVLKGDMSFVGPRPLLPEYLPLYNKKQKRRHEVKPGITGWAQVNGRNAISWEEKFALDVWYVENHSFWFDMKILYMTFLKIFGRSSISKDGHVTVEKFQGSDNEKE